MTGNREYFSSDERGFPLSQPDGSGESRSAWLGPDDFDLILDGTHAIDPAERLLGHLLLIVGGHIPSQDDSAIVRFKPELALSHMGIIVDRF